MQAGDIIKTSGIIGRMAGMRATLVYRPPTVPLKMLEAQMICIELKCILYPFYFSLSQ